MVRKMYGIGGCWWDPYLEAFNSGIINNDACFECPFAREKRCSDLTIGDFWGIGSEAPFHKPDRKVTVIGVNSEEEVDFCRNVHRWS